MIKQCLLALMLFCLLGAVLATAVAQDSGAPPARGGPEQGYGHRHFDPAKRVEMLTKQLKLTSDQQPKVLDILKSEQSKMESLRSDSSVSPEDRRSKMMEIHKASNELIRTLLDSDQQKKWDEMQSRHEQWQGHHHDGQGPGSAPESEQK